MGSSLAQARSPDGFQYFSEAISEAQECRVLEFLGELKFSEVRMHGVAAKRHVVHFGWVYGYETWRVAPGPPLPSVLREVRQQAADVAGLDATMFKAALVTEYPDGAGIGWHRDAPSFGPEVLGVSLAGSCLFRLRPRNVGPTAYQIRLEPRSLYVLSGKARATWQHSIPPGWERRLSITFRSVKPSETEKWEERRRAIPGESR